MIAYFDCFSGISGDMALGALVDAGVPPDLLRERLTGLGIDGYRLEVEDTVDQDIRGTTVRVVLDPTEQPARKLPEIVRLLESSRLEKRVVRLAQAVFERLARAEAAVHGIAPAEVHFHEVGAVDALVDVVGVILGLELLQVRQVYASSLPLGGGSVRSRHGVLPLPAPGTLGILAECGAPTRPSPADKELVTPTGAALLAELAVFEQPPMTLNRIGYGFGQHRLPWPNCLRLWLGEPSITRTTHDEVNVIEANIDDMTPEGLGYAMERLLAAGALDVYFQSLQMKKNRPAVLFGLVAAPAQTAELAALVLSETTTLGVRVTRADRYVAGRELGQVETPFGPVRVKFKLLGESRTASPEYEDVARVARERGVSFGEVYQAAAAAGARRSSAPG